MVQELFKIKKEMTTIDCSVSYAVSGLPLLKRVIRSVCVCQVPPSSVIIVTISLYALSSPSVNALSLKQYCVKGRKSLKS